MRSVGPGRQSPRRHHRPGGIDLRVMDGALQLSAIVGEIGEHVHVQIERHHHGLIALAQNLVQKAGSGVLLGGKAILFAAAGVNEQPQRDGKRFFGGKEGDFLLLIVFEDPKILLFQGGYDVLFLVPHGSKNIDQTDLTFDGGHLLLVALLGGLLCRRLRPHGPRQRPCNQGRGAARHNFVYRTHVYFPGQKDARQTHRAGHRRPIGCS